MDSLIYGRHFLLLVGFAALLDVLTRFQFLTHLYAAFAVYGALHALAVALALRTPQPLAKRVSFIVLGGALSVLTLQIGIMGMQLSGRLPGNTGLYVSLGASALLGAVAYGMLIRLYRIQDLSPLGLWLIGFGCIFGTYAAFFTLAHTHLGRWLLAVFWWCAFSSGLWYCDHRGNSRMPTRAAPAA